MNGKIKKLKSDKGFGFITGDDKVEYFFHHTALVGTRMDTLEEGDPVSFEVDTSRASEKGPRAGVVRVI